MDKGGAPKWYDEEPMPKMKTAKEAFMEDKMEHHEHAMGKHHAMMHEQEQPMEGCMLLAHAYVLWQTYECAFSPREALMKGTLFPELWGVYPIPE